MLQNTTNLYVLGLSLLFLVGCHGGKIVANEKSLDFSIEELVCRAENRKDKNGQKQGLWKWHTIELDGEKWMSGLLTFKDDKKNGRCIRLLKNGEIHTVRHYLSDTLDGYSIVYRPNGTIHYEEVYAEGKLNGIKSWYNLIGVHETDEEWKNGIRDGIIVDYYPSGNILSESSQKDGIENGTRVVYEDSPEKNIIKKFEFVDGLKTSEKSYKNGKLIKERTF